MLLLQFTSNPMADKQLDIKQINSEDMALDIVDEFVGSIIDEKGSLKKQPALNFFFDCLNNLESPTTSPKTKFYTVLMLKQLSNKERITLKIFGTLANHPLYAHLEKMAFTVDPKKSISEKGKQLFPGDKETGNNLMRLIIESFVNWGTRFPNNSKKQPTKFRKTLNRLNDQKVVLPKQFIFYQKANQKLQSPDNSKPQPAKKPTPNDNPSNVAPQQKGKEKYAVEIKFMFNQIQALVGIINEGNELDQIQREVQSYHQKFEKDLQKMTADQQKMLVNQPEDILELFFKILDFFYEEQELYRSHVSQNDYNSYISGFMIAYQRIFSPSDMRKVSKIEDKNTAAIDKKLNDGKGINLVPVGKPLNDKIKSEPSVDQPKQRLKPIKKQQGREREDENVAERGRKLNDAKKSAFQKCFQELDNYPKSPSFGFSSVTKSLDKQKQKVMVSRFQSKVSKVSSVSKALKIAPSSVFAKSAVKLKGIFTNPPNPGLGPKTYSGQLVLENQELENMSREVKKQQGHRRFKMAHFKNNYVMYEDNNLQIGFKFNQIYEKVDKFSTLLNFELFFGNKSDSTIRRFELSFQGDKQSLIYTNPQTVDSTILPLAQIKLDLLNIPKVMPFAFIKIRIFYQIDENPYQSSALLPNSILKMVSYYKLQVQKLAGQWDECFKILKTQPFKLSRHFSPDSFLECIPQLSENSSYSNFCKEGSVTDYELFCQIIIEQSYQGLLKIIVRPNLTVVLQAGIYKSYGHENTKQEKQYTQKSLQRFRFYLQGLEIVLKQAEL